MKYKSQADELIEKAEHIRKLKKMSSRATGIASTLSGKEEIELLTDQVGADLPVLYLNLNTRKEFYERKGDQAKGYLVNLTKDIKKTERYLDLMEKPATLHQLKEVAEYLDVTNDHYGFNLG